MSASINLLSISSLEFCTVLGLCRTNELKKQKLAPAMVHLGHVNCFLVNVSGLRFCFYSQRFVLLVILFHCCLDIETHID